MLQSDDADGTDFRSLAEVDDKYGLSAVEMKKRHRNL